MKILLQNAIFHILMDRCLSVFVLLQLITDMILNCKNCNWGIDLTMLVTHQFLNPIFEGGWSKLKVEFEVTKVGTGTELVVDAGFRIRFRITSFRDQGWWMFDCMKWSASELEIQSFFPHSEYSQNWDGNEGKLVWNQLLQLYHELQPRSPPSLPHQELPALTFTHQTSHKDKRYGQPNQTKSILQTKLNQSDKDWSVVQNS